MRRLYRSRSERMIAGICGGIGQALDVDPTIIRLLVIFITIATAVLPAALTYFIAWVIIPEEPGV